MRRLRNRWSLRDDPILPVLRRYPAPLPVSSLAVPAEFRQLGCLIYPRIYQTGYGRFRPNNSDDHLGRRYYRGGWHRSFPPLLPDRFKVGSDWTFDPANWSPLITISRIVKFSRLLRPVGPGFVSQNPSPGNCSHNPYASKARRYVTPPTT